MCGQLWLMVRPGRPAEWPNGNNHNSNNDNSNSSSNNNSNNDDNNHNSSNNNDNNNKSSGRNIIAKGPNGCGGGYRRSNRIYGFRFLS